MLFFINTFDEPGSDITGSAEYAGYVCIFSVLSQYFSALPMRDIWNFRYRIGCSEFTKVRNSILSVDST